MESPSTFVKESSEQCSLELDKLDFNDQITDLCKESYGLIQKMRESLSNISKSLFLNGDNKSPSPASIETVEKIVQSSLIPFLNQFRRTNRQLSASSLKNYQALENLKHKRRRLNQSITDIKSQIYTLRTQTRKILSSSYTPSFDAVLPQLCPKEEFEQSTTNDKVNQSEEELYTNWLTYDLTCRSNEIARIEERKALRLAGEEKIRVFKKRDADLAVKLAPIEKELTRLLGVNTNFQKLNFVEFPATVYSLPPPLFRIYTQIFVYKAVHNSNQIELKILTQTKEKVKEAILSSNDYKATLSNASNAEESKVEVNSGSLNSSIANVTSKNANHTTPIKQPQLENSVEESTENTTSASSLFVPSPYRIQINIDKANVRLPPTTYLRAAPLFPLSVRFTYFPALNIVSAMCQFPKVIGTDVTLLADLCTSNDSGRTSPNPLHHLVTNINQLLKDDVTLNSENTTDTAAYIASKISELQHGRPYIWAQSLAGISRQNITVNANIFINAFRYRVSLRAWTLYIEENLKHHPNIVPPPGLHDFPPVLQNAAVLCSKSLTSVANVNSQEFRMLSGIIIEDDNEHDTRYLKIKLKIEDIPFFIYMALPLNLKMPEISVQVAPHDMQLMHTAFPYFLTMYSFTSKSPYVKPFTELEESIVNANAISQSSETPTDTSLHDILAASHCAWQEITVDNSTVKALTHFVDVRLEEICKNAQSHIREVYGDRSEKFGIMIPVIQIVYLIKLMHTWIQELIQSSL